MKVAKTQSVTRSFSIELIAFIMISKKSLKRTVALTTVVYNSGSLITADAVLHRSKWGDRKLQPGFFWSASFPTCLSFLEVSTLEVIHKRGQLTTKLLKWTLQSIAQMLPMTLNPLARGGT
jgi:hypothetical protein